MGRGGGGGGTSEFGVERFRQSVSIDVAYTYIHTYIYTPAI